MKKIITIMIGILIALFSINIVIGSDFVLSCNTDNDCKTTSSFYKNGTCINNECKFIGFFSNNICKNNNDCKLPGVGKHINIYSSCVKRVSSDEYGVCSHSFRYNSNLKQYSNDEICSLNFNSNVNLKLKEGLFSSALIYSSSVGSSYCRYYFKEPCQSSIDCFDGNYKTVDRCVVDSFSNKNKCVHIEQSKFCEDDSQCTKLSDPTKFNHCVPDKKMCKVIDINNFYTFDDSFYSYLNYANNINIVGHYKDGRVENFNVDVKTGRVNKGLSSNALLSLVLYEQTIESVREWYYTTKVKNSQKSGIYTDEQVIFRYLFLPYIKTYLNNNQLNTCSVMIINRNLWINNINS